MNKIAKTIFTDFSSLSTISKNFLHLTKNLDKKTLNICSYKLDRNLITNIVNFSLYQENTILPKNYEIQSYVLIKDYNQNLILEEYCRLFSCKVTKKDYITYNLKIEDNIKRNKIKYIKVFLVMLLFKEKGKKKDNIPINIDHKHKEIIKTLENQKTELDELYIANARDFVSNGISYRIKAGSSLMIDSFATGIIPNGFYFLP